MKTEEFTYNDDTYHIREVTMEEAMDVIFESDGKLNNRALMELAVTLNGESVSPSTVSIGVGMKLLPIVYRLNGLGQATEK